MLETERLLLRRFVPGDTAVVAPWARDPRFVRYLPGFDAALSLANAERHWAEHGFGPLAVVERSTGELVGRSGPASPPRLAR